MNKTVNQFIRECEKQEVETEVEMELGTEIWKQKWRLETELDCTALSWQKAYSSNYRTPQTVVNTLFRVYSV